MRSSQLIKLLPQNMQHIILGEKIDLPKLQELRLRIGQPFLYRCDGKEYFPENTYIVREKDMRELVERISHYSLYAYESDMKQGFLTMEGGHRVGFCGEVILDHGKVRNLRYISSLNIRVCHEVLGCSEQINRFLVRGQEVLHSLIISPPRRRKNDYIKRYYPSVFGWNRIYRRKDSLCH